MDVKEEIREFILSHFLKGDKSRKLINDASFIEEGIIDSVGVLELIAFLEEKFGFKVEDEEIIPENFDSVEKLDNFIQSKLAKHKSQI
jgi:acyl carrier protein